MCIRDRIESLILKKSLKDAITRAKAYINAGASAIMIHSINKSPKEIFKFAKIYNNLKNRKPLIVVPTTYNHVKEKEFEKNGINMIIYANHLFRSTYPNMKTTAESILRNKRSKESEKNLMSINEILNLIPGTK